MRDRGRIKSPSSNPIENLRTRLSEQDRNLEDIHRRLTSPTEGRRPELGVPWYMDVLEVKEWGGWPAPRLLRVESMVAVLLTAGSSTTTVHLNKNGTSLESVSFASSESGIVKLPVAATIYPDADYLTAETTAVGTGAAGLTLIARFAP